MIIVNILLPRMLSAQETTTEQKRKEPLELPDVIVYGLDTGMRQAGEKMSAEQSLIAAATSKVSAIYPKLARKDDELGLPCLQESVPGHTTFLSSHVGSFSSWSLRAIHARRLKKADLRLRSNLQGTNGKYDNSGGTRGRIEGRINTPLSSSIIGGLRVGYRRWSYGLYGSANPQRRSRQEVISLHTHIERDFSQSTSSRLEFGLHRFMLTPKKEVAEYPERSETVFRGGFSFQTKSEGFHFISDFQWTHRPSEDDGRVALVGDLSDNFFSLNLLQKAYFLPTASLEVGGKVQWFSRKGMKQKRVFPMVKVVLRPTCFLSFFTSLQGGYRYYPLESLFEASPYAGSHAFPLLQEVRSQVDVGIEMELIPELFVRGSYRWAERHNDVYWNYDITSGLFISGQLHDVRQRQLDLSGGYQPSENVKIEIGYSSIDYEIKDRSITEYIPSAEIPFRPKNRAWGTVSYEIPKTVTIRSDWKWVGQRKAFLPLPYDSFFDTLELDPYFLVNVTFEKEVHRAITLFASFYNLTDSDYNVWYNYREMGITFHGGAKIVW